MISTILDLDTNMVYDSGYSGPSSPSSRASSSPMSQSSDAPFRDFQSLQLASSLMDLPMDNIVKYEYETVPQHTLPQHNMVYQNLDHVQLQTVQLEIIEQPVDKFRFRYKSEMHGTHGSLMAASSTRSKRTYPTVLLKNFNGNALIRCSLYQRNHEMPHSHQLVVRKGDKDIPDPHELQLNPRDGFKAIFQQMGIIHTAKKFIAEELYEKLKKFEEFDLRRPLTLKEDSKLRISAEKNAKSMNLNQVVLCFEAYEMINNTELKQLCQPVFSNPINNMKSALTGELKITRLSHCCSSAAGGDDLFIFVEKVGKKNIKVKFFEINDDEEIVWESWGVFHEADVHHQYAIAMRTPPYKNKDIEENVKVLIQLYRPSDGDTSEPMEFKYKPRENVSKRKRARTCSSGIGSTELPTTLFNDTNSGTTISEEFDKSKVLEDEFLNHVKGNSSELMNMFDSNLFDQIDSGDLQLDGVGGSSASLQTISIKSPTKLNMNKIVNWLRGADRTEAGMAKAKKNIVDLFKACNDIDEDILHNIIKKNEINEGMCILKIINRLKIFEVLQLQNDDGDTCLHIACCFNRFEYIRSLINLGINPNKQNNKGKTALHIAVEDGFTTCVSKILAKENYTVLSIPLVIDIANNDGYTALHLAVKKQNLNLVKELLEVGGASTKICIMKNGNNVLHLAIEEKNPKIIQYLITNTNVSLTHQNTSGFTPLAMAQSMNKEEGKQFVDILLQKSYKYGFFEVNVKSESSSESDDDNKSIKSLKIDESQEFEAEDFKIEFDLDYLTDDVIEKLVKMLSVDDKWKKLAEIINLESFVCLWKSPDAMLNYINESKHISISDIMDALIKMEEFEALRCVKRGIKNTS